MAIDNFSVNGTGGTLIVDKLADAVMRYGMDPTTPYARQRVVSALAAYDWSWKWLDVWGSSRTVSLPDRLAFALQRQCNVELTDEELKTVATIALANKAVETKHYSSANATIRLTSAIQLSQRLPIVVTVATGEIVEYGRMLIVREITREINEDRLAKREAWRAENPNRSIYEAPTQLYQSMIALSADHLHHYLHDTLNWKWTWTVNGKGEYIGTLPKRLGKFVKKTYGINLSNETLQAIGNIANQYTEQEQSYTFDVTNVVDWGKSDFGQRSSCWWGTDAIQLLEQNGAAIRFWEEVESRHIDEKILNGYGRVWVVPCKPKANTFIIFNGYGMADGYNSTLIMARVLASHFGLSYKQISLTNNEGSGEVYINSGGYVIGPSDAIEGIYSHELAWGEDARHTCADCGDPISDDDPYFFDDNNDEYVCHQCYEQNWTTCENCGNATRTDDARQVYRFGYRNRRQEMTWCDHCHENETATCCNCDETWITDLCVEVGTGGDWACPDCAEDTTECVGCGYRFFNDDFFEHDGKSYCVSCREEYFAVCDRCEEEKPVEEFADLKDQLAHDVAVCKTCIIVEHAARELTTAAARMLDEGSLTDANAPADAH